jgi:hypothetical protein
MSDIFREVDEDLRREQYKAIWKKYGNYIVAVAVLIVVATGGYRGWQYWQARQAAESGDRYVAALQMADEGKKAEAIASLDELARGGHGAYPYFAALRAAALKTADGDMTGAAVEFDKVAADTGAPPLLRDVARLRAALALSDTASLADLETRISDLAKSDSPFRHTAREILALAAWRADDMTKASAYLTELAGDPAVGSGARQRADLLQQLIRGRQGAPPAAPAPAAPAEADAVPNATAPGG